MCTCVCLSCDTIDSIQLKCYTIYYILTVFPKGCMVMLTNSDDYVIVLVWICIQAVNLKRNNMILKNITLR